LSTITLALESTLAIVAGADTTSTTLGNAFFYLLQMPGMYDKLRAELDTAAAGAPLDIDLEPKTLAGLPFLNAIM
jgi:cytochrome P450